MSLDNDGLAAKVMEAPMTTNSNAALLTDTVPVRGPTPGVQAVLSGLWRWYRRQRDLRHLNELDDYLLRDIGLKRSQVEAEFTKPAWRR
ncbi:MAG: DUF1127 domain-containing protein [Kiloniellaceae bacterium]